MKWGRGKWGRWTLSLWGMLLAAEPASAGLQAVTLPWSTKVRPGTEIKGGDRISLSAARGECEGAQVLVRPPARKVEALEPTLEGPGPALRVRLYREAFIHVRTPSNGQGAAGPWPDPLIPLKDSFHHERRMALPASSLPDSPLVFYLEVCVPRGQPPGTYRGKLTLGAEGSQSVSIPLQIQVQPFLLPASSTLRNSFGLFLEQVCRGHGLDPASPEGRTLLSDYATALLAHRVSAYGLSRSGPKVRSQEGGLDLDFTRYDAEFGPFLDGSASPQGAHFTSVGVPHGPRSLSDAERVIYLGAVREHLAKRGWRGQLFFYAKDEPRPEDVPLVLAQSARARRAGVPVLITAPLDTRLTPAADIACPNLNCFFSRPGRPTCRNVQPAEALRKKLGPGKHVWWYQSCSSHGCDQGPMDDVAIERAYSGWASYMVDHPATLNRAMGPLAFLAAVDGELYFDTTFAYTTQDPWKDVFAFGGNGDGTFFYPGTPEQVGGTTHIPIDSLRLKHLRDGLEDYEYLVLAAQVDPALARRSVERLARSGYEINADPEIWDAVRATLSSILAGHAVPK